MFIAPELTEAGILEDSSGFKDKSSWDVAIRFQDLQKLGNISDKEKALLRQRAIQGVLDQAKQSLRAAPHPEQIKVLDYHAFLESGERGELDVLSTLDEELSSGFSNKNPTEHLRFDARIDKKTHLSLVMDASLSMRGEKIATLAVATAVVALCVPVARVSLMGFDSKSTWIKRFGEELKIEQIIERVLELPAGGFTNLELALTETVKNLDYQRKEHANVVLISDGKYTEGRDPSSLALKFKHLNVLKIGRDQAGRELLLELSHKGNGKFFEARKMHDLPRVMYSVMQTLLR